MIERIGIFIIFKIFQKDIPNIFLTMPNNLSIQDNIFFIVIGLVL